MIAWLQALRRQAGRYFGAVAWLFGLVFSRYRRRAFAVFAGSAIGVALVGAGVAGIFAVVSVLETGGAISMAGVEFRPEAAGQMVGVAAIASLLIMLGAVAVFAARSTSIGVASDLLKYLTASVLATYGGIPPHPLDFRSDRHLRAAIGRLRTSYARKCFLVVRQTFEAPVLILTFAAGVAAMVWLQPTAAVAVTLVVALVLPAYYLVNMAAVSATKRFEALSRAAARESKALAQTYAQRPHDPPGEIHAAFQAATASQERIHTFARRFLATVRADLTSQLTSAIALLALLAYLGSQVLAESLSVTAAVAFMLVLRFMLTAMRGVFRSFALLSRHYPSVYRFYLFSTGQDRVKPLPPGARFKLRLMPGGLRAPEAPKRTWRVGPGSVLGVNAPVTPSRFSVWYYASLLAGGSDIAGALAIRDATRVAVVPPAPRSPTSLRRHFGVADTMAFETLIAATGAGAAASLCAQSVDSLDATYEPEAFAALPGATTAALALAAARSHAPSVIIASARMLLDDIRSQAGEALIVSRHRIRPLRDIADAHLVAASDGAIVAWGSPRWIRENWSDIRAHRAMYEDELERILGEDVEGEDDEDDDA